MSAFTKQAVAVGFSQDQADFLDKMLAKFPHEHDIGDVEGLHDRLEDLEGEEDDEGDDEG
jgi:hypothetical protein